MALVYRSILAKLSVGLISSYAKADVRKRALAAVADGLFVAVALFYYRSWGSPVYLFAGAAYLLLRDAMGGRSLGKFLFGLMVVDLETGRPCGSRASISRNVLLLLPGANIVASFLEASTIIRDPQGQRLGDRFALTQVVEGFGAKDLVMDLYQSFLDILEEFNGQFGDRGRKPGRVPVKLQRRVEIRSTEPPPQRTPHSTAEEEDERDLVIRH
jgi:uncharacterized RDD family membrane protein YckC